jgi:hypothetical protein
MSVLIPWNQKIPVLEQSDLCRVETFLLIIEGNQTLKTYEVCLMYQIKLYKFEVTVKFVFHINKIKISYYFEYF